MFCEIDFIAFYESLKLAAHFGLTPALKSHFVPEIFKNIFFCSKNEYSYLDV